MAERSILITGCSSGIGYCCAMGLKERGWNVIATAHEPEEVLRLNAEGLETLYLNYADPASIETCADEVLARTNRSIFALFNNGAYCQPGAVEDLSRDVLRAQFEVNFFGWHDLTCRLIPAMREQGRGRIVQNSSILGLVAVKWLGAYNASKFALEGLSDTLRLELRGSGIHVSQIEPGPIATNVAAEAKKHFQQNIDVEKSVHRERYTRQRDPEEKKPQRSGNRLQRGPEAVLKKLIHAVESSKPKAHYYVTVPAYVMAGLKRALPQRWIDPIFSRFSDN